MSLNHFKVLLRGLWVGAIGLLLGVVIGVLGVQRVEVPKNAFLFAASADRQLFNALVVLKMLDEGRPDFAKSFLEIQIRASLDSASAMLNDTDHQEMQERLKKTIRLVRLALADRTKSYEQLQKEAAR